MSPPPLPPTTARQALVDRFWEVIPPVWNEVRSHVRAIAVEEFGITIEQFHILRHIRKGIDSMSELADAKQISRPAISQAVDLLVDKGLIIRQQNPTDRRYVNLSLSPSGDELINAIFKQNRAWMIDRFAALSDAEVSTMLLGMDGLAKAFVEFNPAPQRP
ncbi:MAG: MarR family transcriptional regulator [Anaerolineales bacterium]|nr:MarR family transcriptional regulator [Anaerolineales bacterium]